VQFLKENIDLQQPMVRATFKIFSIIHKLFTIWGTIWA